MILIDSYLIFIVTFCSGQSASHIESQFSEGPKGSDSNDGDDTDSIIDGNQACIRQKKNISNILEYEAC